MEIMDDDALGCRPPDDDVIVCRCEEITLGEIKDAIRMGARDINGVKRRTRAGMGTCQGRTCERMVQQILQRELGIKAEEIAVSTARTPTSLVSFGVLGEEGTCARSTR